MIKYDKKRVTISQAINTKVYPQDESDLNRGQDIFSQVWEHYDTDSNGFIEGEELDDFLREFVSSVHPDQEEVCLFQQIFLCWANMT